MTIFKTDNKIAIAIICAIGLLFYVLPFISSIEGKKYHREFKKIEFDELSIEMYSNFTDEIIEAQITDKDEIEFYYNIFANRLEYAQIKKKKLYSYSVFLRFYNTDSKEKYIFKVYFDYTEEVIRPVSLRLKEEDLGGYAFALYDEELEFHNKIMELWETSEKSRL